jgi:3-deoxy-7-phosphoheptulonate synthase
MNKSPANAAGLELENLNIQSQEILATPAAIKVELPASNTVRQSVNAHRQSICSILARSDHRFIVVTGPCSIHNVDEALEYAHLLSDVATEIEDNILVVMRAYFEKPRTTIGWKGFINDPYLDDSFRIEAGLRMARRLLLEVSALGLPLATEALDPITPQYLHDLISWTVIGARTTESQTHREMASGLSAPLGFKNGTDGGFDVALNAIESAAHPHRFLGIDERGQVAITTTKGNRTAHIVLRGGDNGPNYTADAIAECEKSLSDRALPANIMVDCSHANSLKDHTLQNQVAEDIGNQISKGNQSIIGLMLESTLHAGKQSFDPRKQPEPGVSITDACISFDETAEILRTLNDVMANPLRRRQEESAA